jgi:hypothetical protein
MKRAPLLLLVSWLLPSSAALPADDAGDWPALTQTARPWTRWWWPGSAVEPSQLSAQLQAFADAGLGGVEITPIYGARGAEARDIPYLSDRWVEMLRHTAREADRLGIGVDMATGTGWPFGGPRVAPGDGSSALALIDGRLAGKPTDMKVKRAAPGGEGLVLDPYSSDVMDRYLAPFTQALAAVPRGAVRSQFHDSFEYFNASWSPQLPAAFARMHGYDIQSFAAELAGAKPMDADTLGRIKGDYRRTLAALHLGYLQGWIDWSHANGFRARNQAHGAPGRLLDLYGASDIPETESFGATRLPIPGLHQAPADINEDPDPPINLIGRFASSAAHVMGRPLVSSETLTWLRENFRETPAAAKPQLDRLFIAGINHVFYHGATYSPADAPWPGWYFYAATQLNPTNPLWRDFAAMHAYVGRVQSVLQSGRPDNDVLLYWPEADWQDSAEGLMRQQGMHENAWLLQSPAGRMAQRLLAAGFSFDFISDAQLASLSIVEGQYEAPGGRYRALLVPRVERMPLETLARLAALAEAGGVLMLESLPRDVPGHGGLMQRREALARLLSNPRLQDAVRVDIEEALSAAKVIREAAAARGLWLTRRARDEGHDYFLVNPTATRVEEWLPLGVRAEQARLMDPLTGEHGIAATRTGPDGLALAYLQLESGQSMILRTFARAPRRRAAPAWKYFTARSPGRTLTGWRVDFLRGGPALPPPVTMDELTSWTRLPSADATRFAGTARYRVEFDGLERGADDWLLDLGEVRETARVTLNGRLLGTSWSLPAVMRVGTALEAGRNVLEIEVTNLPANRIRDLDARKVDWKIMKDINLASLRYRALDASTWEPVPSGLLGPVRIIPLRRWAPTVTPSTSVP